MWNFNDLSKKQKRLVGKSQKLKTDLIIPIELPSPNVYLKWHWAKRGRLKKTLASAMTEAVPPSPYNAVNLHVTRVCVRRVTDADNEFFIVKPLLDAMVTAGILIDDNKNIIKRLNVDQLTRKQAEDATGNSEPRTIIRIEVLND